MPRCIATLSKSDILGFSSRQVFDIPKSPPFCITKHPTYSCQYKGCGAKVRAAFPDGVNEPVQYGNEITSLVSYLQTMQCLPGHRAAMLLSKWRCVKLSSGTVTSLTARKAKKFREAHIRLHDILSSGQVSVKHLDEPGFRVAGRLEWLHILCSRLLSHLRLGERRGDIPRDLEGTVIHDCLSSYFTLENVRHGTGVCNAQHLIRELNAAYDIDGEPWAVEIKAILYDERDLAKPLAVHVKTQSTLLLSRKSYDDMRLVDRKTSCITKVYRLSRFHQIKKQGKKTQSAQ